MTADVKLNISTKNAANVKVLHAVVLLNVNEVMFISDAPYNYIKIFFSSKVCEKGRYGKTCEYKCCNGRGACDVVNGKVCFCDDGYDGEKCEHSKYF